MLRTCGLFSRPFSSPFLRKFARFQSTIETPVVTAELDEALESTFTIFPRIQDVKPEELLGGGSLERRTYFVERSSTGNLPVYTDYKAGGNKLVTEIRKVSGDIVQLRNDLQAELPHIPKEAWAIRPQSKKIVIKGNVALDIKTVLQSKF